MSLLAALPGLPSSSEEMPLPFKGPCLGLCSLLLSPPACLALLCLKPTNSAPSSKPSLSLCPPPGTPFPQHGYQLRCLLNCHLMVGPSLTTSYITQYFSSSPQPSTCFIFPYGTNYYAARFDDYIFSVFTPGNVNSIGKGVGVLACSLLYAQH